MIKNWSIFTKPWKDKTPEELGQFVSNLGFNAIEFPLRPGYQVEPDHAEQGLPALNQTLKQYGVHISSVASSTEESIFAACQAAGIPLIRIMAFADPSIGYLKSIEQKKREFDALVPLCEKYNVAVGVQNHFGFGTFNSMELRYLLDGFDPKHIGAVWDAAHSALSGEIPAQGLDIIWDKLVLVNIKTAFYKRVNGPEAVQAHFEPYFTTGRNGAASWEDIAAVLKSRNYNGDICMPAEYTDAENVEKYIVQDFAYLRSLFSCK